jgi:probable rRNA maturation factor
MNTPIRFFYQIASFQFGQRKMLKCFLSNTLFRKEGIVIKEVRIIFCNDNQLLRINQNFLNHNYYTDIITFNFSNNKESLEAELYISIERVKDNARSSSVSFLEELHRVIFHGCLHLCGYNDKTSQQIKKIRSKEDHYLRLYFNK